MAVSEETIIRKLTWRLLPILIFSYFIAILDRANVGVAALTMNQDLGLSMTAFGFAASIFFVPYVLLLKSRRTSRLSGSARVERIARTHADLGTSGRRPCVSLECRQPLCAACASGRGGGRFLSGRRLLPDALVSVGLSRPHHQRLHGRHSDLAGDRARRYRRFCCSSMAYSACMGGGGCICWRACRP